MNKLWHSALLLLLSLMASVAQAEPGFLGISYTIDGDNFIPNRLVKAVRVNNLVLGSPAARAGIKIGDELLEVDGKKIPGARVSELKPLMDKPAGHLLELVIKADSGEVRTVKVLLTQRPLR